MAQAAIIFKDVGKEGEGKVDVGFEFPDIEEQQMMTPALYNAALISFILERGYHKQFQEEFSEIMEEEEESGV